MNPQVKQALNTTANEVLKPMVQGLAVTYDLDEKQLAEVVDSVMAHTYEQTGGNAAQALAVFALCIMTINDAQPIELPPTQEPPS